MTAKANVKTILVIIGLALALGGGYLLGSNPHEHEHDATVPGTGQEARKVQYTCSMHPFIIRDAPGSCPICGMSLTPVKVDKNSVTTGNEIQKWRSPMDPTYVRDAPGKDSMGHDLVLVTESGTASEGIRIDPLTIQNMGVRTEKVVKRKLQRTVRTIGLISAAEDQQFSVNSKIDGWVERLFVNQQGQPIKKGQPLLEIYSPDLVAAQQEYLLALENRRRLAASPYPEIAAGADRLLEASRTRLQYWDISPEQIRSMERSGQVHKTLTLASEHAGVVTSKKVLSGARIMAGEELLQITDLSKVWIIADIYEYEIPWVKAGQAVQVELPLAGSKVIDGTISYLYPYLENETRAIKARIEVANPGQDLKPSMYANVSIGTGAVEDSLAIPLTALLNSGKGQTVFVSLGEGRFAPRSVKSGVRDDDGFIQILSGLNEGDEVVVSAQFMLDSESRLREALDKMSAPKTSAAAPAPEAIPAEKKADAKALDELFK
ncbi:MAG: efflux RND transporter periplasmic adaptor subunit [Desulfobulbaceae bacterium]|nr:efflux RND transporter periplasmic adaptor subunit [Desulfobulbaceae bacterium]